MKKSVLSFLIFLTFAGISYSHAAEVAVNALEVRQEFDAAFGNVKIYQAIKKYLPDQYEELFRSYLRARESQDIESFRTQVASYVNRIRNAYLKQSSDKAIFEFYSHITSTGRNIFERNPEAAFSYIFGGDPNAYSTYVDFDGEMNALGELFDQLLSSRSEENVVVTNAEEVENGFTLVFLGLYYKYGDNIRLLQTNAPAQLTSSERSRLCTMYLDMYDEIFKLEPPTRSHVLRSLAVNM